MKVVVIGIVAIIGVFVGSMVFYTVDESQQAIIVQFGEPIGDGLVDARVRPHQVGPGRRLWGAAMAKAPPFRKASNRLFSPVVQHPVHGGLVGQAEGGVGPVPEGDGAVA